MDRGDGAAANQILNARLRTIEFKRKIREQDELEERLAALVQARTFGFVGLLQTPPNLGGALRQWALAFLVFVQALLCSPSLDGRPRAVLRARAIASVVTFAVMGVVAMTFYADGYLFGVALVAAFLVFILCFYYFANRRRYRRSGPYEEA